MLLPNSMRTMLDQLDDARREDAKSRLVNDFGLSKAPELEVLLHLVEGKGDSEIASALKPYGVYTENYVKRVLREIRRKMGVRNRVQVALIAMYYGLTPKGEWFKAPKRAA